MSCAHYLRKCILLSPCCGREYTCRICHDEVEDHLIDRRAVTTLICMQCKEKQNVGRNCKECGILFGSYSCLVCRLFDDNDKQQFHCEGCGICRVGGKDNFFHCPKCNICISKSLLENHTCVENMSRGKCPVCLEDLHSTREKVNIPACSHMIHTTCAEEMFKHGKTSCPTCNTSMVDMRQVWESIDEAVAHTQMPEIYRNYHVSILCRDCHKTSKVVFHVIGLKCAGCGGYNTTRVGGDDPLPEEATGNLEHLAIDHDSDDSTNSWETIYTEEDEVTVVSAGDLDAVVTGNDDTSVHDQEEAANNENTDLVRDLVDLVEREENSST